MILIFPFLAVIAISFPSTTFAGMFPGKLNCKSDNFVFDGYVPGDTKSVLATINSSGKTIVIVTEEGLSPADVLKFKKIPQISMTIEQSTLPYNGKYLLKLKGTSHSLSITSISSKLKETVVGDLNTYTFKSNIEFNFKEFNQNKMTSLKNVDCKWSHGDEP